MKVTMFYHSLVSDWNHGNAHFLRGVVREFQRRGHEVTVYEEENNWSLTNLLSSNGQQVMQDFLDTYPTLKPNFYNLASLDLNKVLSNQDLVIVHEWSDHGLVEKIGAHKAQGGSYLLLFHDTHHRSVTDEQGIKDYNLKHYDGVLAFGELIRDKYLKNQWAQNAWTWHEAADTNVFYPRPKTEKIGDLVWIGNWGDEERTKELFEFLINPVKELGLKAKIYGVRYPKEALNALEEAGIEYGGWLPNYLAPEVFAQYKVTVHVPRRPYVEALPGIPTIRPFEALACGIPLISSPWNDMEGMFSAGKDYLVANSKEEMKQHLSAVINNKELAKSLSENGFRTIQKRHSCSHRVDELLNIIEQVQSKSVSLGAS